MIIRSCIEHVISRAPLKAEDSSAVGISAPYGNRKEGGGEARKMSTVGIWTSFKGFGPWMVGKVSFKQQD